MLGDLLDHPYLVYTVLQLKDPAAGYPVGAYDLLPRRNFIPQQNIMLLEIFGATGVALDDPAFEGLTVCVKSQEKLGILNDIVPDLIWKKNARQAWAEFGERFGMPMVTATTNKTSKKDLDRIEAMVKQLSSAARGVLPMGTTVDIKDGVGRGDPYKIYLEQIKYADASISKRILGGTMISDDGSSRSQSEVHKETLDGIIAEADMKKMEFAVNDQILPSKLGRHLGFTTDDEFCFDRTQDIDPGTLWTIVSGMLQRFKISTKWISKKFNVPIEGEKEAGPNPNAPAGFFD
jgi:phage gp29-like protein